MGIEVERFHLYTFSCQKSEVLHSSWDSGARTIFRGFQPHFWTSAPHEILSPAIQRQFDTTASQCHSMHLRRLTCIASKQWAGGRSIDFSKHIHSLVIPRANSQHLSRRFPLSASSCKGRQPSMAPRPELEKQYMSSGSKPKKPVAEPRPSAS